ncbi:MAG TPA: DHH family phosphoesterase, partial [Symbiobacteriaceae bacterium]|nr:DHH family phosphoesterase [Symbiobacteriaceae bacterium]
MAIWRRPDPLAIPDELLAVARSRPVAELLLRRGLQTPAAIEEFLTGGIDVDAPGLPDLDEGVALVAKAVEAGARICVWGDYDTDGITSTTLLVDLLRSLNAEVTYYIPNRFRDGYGMNPRTVEALQQEGVQLILTCDCGIKSLDEVALAKSLGLQVVITDHHELGSTLPAADAVINPKRLAADHPCYMLPGVGTAYLFARQLLRSLDCDPAEADIWLDLVAVGIIADVVPLTGANR